MPVSRAGRVLEAFGRGIRRDVINAIAAHKDAVVDALFGQRPAKRVKIACAEVRRNIVSAQSRY